jgi:hypothetical protein
MSETTQAPAPTEEAQQGPQLFPKDLEGAVQVIDYAFQKGAFNDPNAAEAAVAVRRRIVNFLEFVAKQQGAATPEATPADEKAD